MVLGLGRTWLDLAKQGWTWLELAHWIQLSNWSLDMTGYQLDDISSSARPSR